MSDYEERDDKCIYKHVKEMDDIDDTDDESILEEGFDDDSDSDKESNDVVPDDERITK